MPSGVAAYLIQYRTIQGKSRRYAFARVGTLTLDEAKAKARRLLSETREGADPSALKTPNHQLSNAARVKLRRFGLAPQVSW
jgi:hypothetical protein